MYFCLALQYVCVARVLQDASNRIGRGFSEHTIVGASRAEYRADDEAEDDDRGND